MYIRCPACRQATWIKTLGAGHVGQVECKGCRRRYTLEATPELDAEGPDRYRNAVRFAESNRIDLPGAYSVLFGLMTLEEARVAERSAAAEPPAAGRPAAGAASRAVAGAPSGAAGPMEIPYDPGFHQAVEAGQLSVLQAVERGDRAAYATRLATRHDLPMAVAYLVADNQITVESARRRVARERQRHAPAPRKKPVTRGQRSALLTVATAVLVAAGIYGARNWERMVDESETAQANTERAALPLRAARAEPPPPADPTALALSRADVRLDDDGRIVKVVGPDPRSVLLAYCAAAPAGRLDPVDLAPTVPPANGARLGLFRDSHDPTALRGIRIRRDRKTRRWSAGNGRSPIQPSIAPTYPESFQSSPMSRR